MRKMIPVLLLGLIAACAPAMTEGRMVSTLLQKHGWMANCDEMQPDPRREGDVLCVYRRMVKLNPTQLAQMDSAMKACQADANCRAPQLPFRLAYPELSEVTRYPRAICQGPDRYGNVTIIQSVGTDSLRLRVDAAEDSITTHRWAPKCEIVNVTDSIIAVPITAEPVPASTP